MLLILVFAPFCAELCPAIYGGLLRFPGGGELVGLVVVVEGANQFVDIAVKYRLKAIQRQPDPMVGHPPLREIIRPNLGRSIPGADHRAALGGDFLLLFVDGPVQQARPQNFQRFVLIL